MTRGEFAAVPMLGGLLASGERVLASAAQPYTFDRQAFVRRATLPFRHRQLFAARALSSGVVLHLMANSLKAYNAPNGFGNGPHSLHAAAVLYGTSITALLTDSAWHDLQLPAFLQRLGDLPDAEATSNPYGGVVADLARANASFFVCNNALHDVAQAVARATSPADSNAQAAYAALYAGLRPEAFVVPAGVAALNALQEYHFTLVQATV